MKKDKPVYIVLETKGIGGAEKRFTDLWGFFVQKKFNIHLVIDKSAHNELLQNERYRRMLLKYSNFVHVLNLYGSTYASFFLNLHRFFWKQPRMAIVHFPLTYVFGLKLLYGHKIVSSYVSVYNLFKSKSVSSLKHDVFRFSGFVFSDVIDVLDPDIFKRLKNIFIFSGKISLTAGGTHVNNNVYRRLHKKPYFTFLGRFDHEKQVLRLVSILPKVNDELIYRGIADYKFVICGKGEDESLINILLSTGIYSQVPIEVCYTQSPENILGESAIFFSLQKTSNYPSKALAEALVCGCYPIVTDVGSTDLMLSKIPYFTKIRLNFEAQDILEGILNYFELSSYNNIDKIAEAISSEGREIFRIDNQAKYFHDIYKSL